RLAGFFQLENRLDLGDSHRECRDSERFEFPISGSNREMAHETVGWYRLVYLVAGPGSGQVGDERACLQNGRLFVRGFSARSTGDDRTEATREQQRGQYHPYSRHAGPLRVCERDHVLDSKGPCSRPWDTLPFTTRTWSAG